MRGFSFSPGEMSSLAVRDLGCLYIFSRFFTIPDSNIDDRYVIYYEERFSRISFPFPERKKLSLSCFVYFSRLFFVKVGGSSFSWRKRMEGFPCRYERERVHAKSLPPPAGHVCNGPRLSVNGSSPNVTTLFPSQHLC